VLVKRILDEASEVSTCRPHERWSGNAGVAPRGEAPCEKPGDFGGAVAAGRPDVLRGPGAKEVWARLSLLVSNEDSSSWGTTEARFNALPLRRSETREFCERFL
jgi:hypothetical protein